MRILVLSDIHDHIDVLSLVLEQVKDQMQAAVFCGDMCSPFTAGILGNLEVPIYACLGNNDEDHLALSSRGGGNFHWTFLAQEYGQVELDGKKIAFCHYPKLAELLANTGEHDAVFHGHTHNAYKKYISNTLLLNPGAVCGIQGGRLGRASYAVYDTQSHTAEIVRLSLDK